MNTEFLLDFTVDCSSYFENFEGDITEESFHKLTKEFIETFIEEQFGLDKCFVQKLKLCKRNSLDEDWVTIKQF